MMSLSVKAMAQNVGIGTSSPRPSAQLDVSSTNKGMLIPRMTSTQRKAISNPEFGLMVFDTDKGSILFFDGQKWRALSFTDENASTETVRNANDVKAYARYGTAVAISGDFSIVGAPRYQAGTVAAPLAYSGAAYILYKTATGWVQQAKLLPPDSAANSFFGGAVAISGDYAVVSAVKRTVGTTSNAGKIYVYKRSGTNWLIDTVFTKPVPVVNEYFGWSIAVSATASGGPVVAVGIPYSAVAGAGRGEVYTYKRNSSNTWNFIQFIRPIDLINQDNFGYNVVMDGDYLAVCAPYQDNGSYIDGGAVYIFVHGGGAFTQQHKISGFTNGGQLGAGMAMDDNRLALGAPWQTNSPSTTAAVWIYTRAGATWTLISSLVLYEYEVPGHPTVNTRAVTFGLGLALRGNDLLIGAPGGTENPNGAQNVYQSVRGSVYHYRNHSGNVYSRVKTISPQSGSAGDIFGSFIGLSNGRYIIGNPRANSSNLPESGGVLFGEVGSN